MPMKTKNVHLAIIVVTIIILFAPLFFFTLKFISNYVEYKSCKSLEDYEMLCYEQENENSLLNHNVFYSKALLKREELYERYSADSIRIADSIAVVEAAAAAAAAAAEVYNIENDYFISLIRCATFHSYYNSRFGFYIAYPSFLTAEVEPANGDGRRFSMEDSEILLDVSGIYNINDESIENSYHKNNIQSAIYSTLKDNWYIISGYTIDGRVFYQKTVLYNEAFITAILYYPPKYKNEFDVIIKRIFIKFPYLS